MNLFTLYIYHLCLVFRLVNAYQNALVLPPASQVDLGSCPQEIVERAMDSKELKRVLSRHQNAEELVLKVVGREEYLIAQKPVSSYKVCLVSLFMFQFPVIA